MELSKNSFRSAERLNHVASTEIGSKNGLSTASHAFSVRESTRLSLLGFEYFPLVP